MKRLLLLSVLLAGCEATAADYSHPGVADAAYARESADCEMKGEQSRTMGGFGGATGIASYYETYNRVYDACMRSKGYARAP